MDNVLDGFVPFVKGTLGRGRKHELTGKPGCYVFTDPASEKLYVGSTTNLPRRVSSNLSDLKHDKHCNRNLQAAYNNNHNLVIRVKPTDTTEEARQLEQEVVDKLHPSDKLHNIAVKDVMRPCLGISMSDETKQKISELHLGKLKSEEHKQKLSTTLKEYLATDEGKAAHARCIEKTKEPVECKGVVYSSLTEAAKALGVSHVTIINRCKSDNFPDYNKLEGKHV